MISTKKIFDANHHSNHIIYLDNLRISKAHFTIHQLVYFIIIYIFFQ